MPSRNNVLGRRLCTALAVLTSTVVASGCREYLDRRDAMTLELGDAIATNKATQTIDRWPEHSGRDRWLSDGERARLAVQRYRAGKVKEPKTTESGSTQSQSQPAATGAE
jgi:hypothetical protein